MWIAQISDTHLRPEGVSYNGVVDPANYTGRANYVYQELRDRKIALFVESCRRESGRFVMTCGQRRPALSTPCR